MDTQIGSKLKERVGNTPLLRVARVTAGLDGVLVLAKVECSDSTAGQHAGRVELQPCLFLLQLLRK